VGAVAPSTCRSVLSKKLLAFGIRCLQVSSWFQWMQD